MRMMVSWSVCHADQRRTPRTRTYAHRRLAAACARASTHNLVYVLYAAQIKSVTRSADAQVCTRGYYCIVLRNRIYAMFVVVS